MQHAGLLYGINVGTVPLLQLGCADLQHVAFD
jgi:hypothetical protein